jgi:hypothetical protein
MMRGGRGMSGGGATLAPLGGKHGSVAKSSESMCASTYVGKYVYICVCEYVCMHVCMDVWMYGSMQICW